MKVEKLDLAMGDCKISLEKDPSFCKAYNRLSKCHIALGDLEAAEATLQKSCELEPQNPMNEKD